jgi:hypothetical protein
MQITKHEHVVPREDGWAVKVADGERASRVFESREEAIEYAKELAKKHNVCMVVHDEKAKFKDFVCNPELSQDLEMEKEECAPAGYHEESEMCIPAKFDNKLTVLDQHVIKKGNEWAVVTEGENVAKTFPNKGSAMAYAYETATKSDSCMLVHYEDGRFRSIACPPDGNPGILEVVRMNREM